MTDASSYTNSREYHVVVMGAGEPVSSDYKVCLIRGPSTNGD